MKEQEIIEGNKIIAEFMGIKEIKSSYDSYGIPTPIWHTENDYFRSSTYSVPNESFYEFVDNAKYHTSWDWLMPVVNKIFKLYTQYPKAAFEIYKIRIVIDIYTLWLSVIKFIKFYNNERAKDNKAVV
jgi:hypothetical protein